MCLDIDGNEINVGDTVICVETKEHFYLSIGKEYKVLNTAFNILHIDVGNNKGIKVYKPHRFRIKPIVKPKIPKEKYDKLPSYMKEAYEIRDT